MSFVQSENPASADFVSGKTLPNNGDSGTSWWNVIIGAFSHSSNREQALAKLAGVDPATLQRTVIVPLVPTYSTGPSVQIESSGNGSVFILCTSVLATFDWVLDGLVTGQKIKSCTIYYQANASYSALPGNMPRLRVYKTAATIGSDFQAASPSLLGEQLDTSANAAAFIKTHAITVSGLNETVVDNYQYMIDFRNDGGSGSNPYGTIVGLKYVLGL